MPCLKDTASRDRETRYGKTKKFGGVDLSLSKFLEALGGEKKEWMKEKFGEVFFENDRPYWIFDI
jgi:hypothetical protein